MALCFIDSGYPIHGSHMTIERTLAKTAKKYLNFGMSVCQVYFGSRQTFKRRVVSDTDIKKTRRILKRYNSCLFSHCALCYNLAKVIYPKSLLDEISAFSELNYSDKITSGTIIHVGKHTNPDEGINNVIENVNSLLGKNSTRILILENAAGQGWKKPNNNKELGSTLRDIETIYDGVTEKDRLYFCIDTQHLFARGEWPIHELGVFGRFLTAFEEQIGVDKIACVHLNDSKTVYGSQVDRHAPLGKGSIFKDVRVLHDLITVLTEKRIPMISETGEGYLETNIVRALHNS